MNLLRNLLKPEPPSPKTIFMKTETTPIFLLNDFGTDLARRDRAAARMDALAQATLEALREAGRSPEAQARREQEARLCGTPKPV
jgi:hypothetical protein